MSSKKTAINLTNFELDCLGEIPIPPINYESIKNHEIINVQLFFIVNLIMGL
jgi:hypothetical protein